MQFKINGHTQTHMRRPAQHEEQKWIPRHRVSLKNSFFRVTCSDGEFASTFFEARSPNTVTEIKCDAPETRVESE